MQDWQAHPQLKVWSGLHGIVLSFFPAALLVFASDPMGVFKGGDKMVEREMPGIMVLY